VNRTGAHHIIFTTVTDVGSTLLIGLVLHHLRQSGGHALAMKPLPSRGSRADVEFLHAVQDGELAPDENYLFLPFGTLLANTFSRSV
jgi:dethiobiotin synthetase